MPDQQNEIKLEREFAEAYVPVREYTMVDWERCYSVWNSLNYVLNAGIPGALVECGVWKGGICMLMANSLRAKGVTDRDLYLYDTFAGMVEPTERDVSFSGEAAHAKWQQSRQADHNTWCYAPLEEVQQNLASTGYDIGRCRFVQGKTQDTLPATVPDQIALLRLDTDWYESTYHELTHLYPRLAPGGVIIFDDAYFWHGQRMALERYFEEQGIALCLNRIGISSVAVKSLPYGLSKAERQRAAA